jgi:hypothetical protein
VTISELGGFSSLKITPCLRGWGEWEGREREEK